MTDDEPAGRTAVAALRSYVLLLEKAVRELDGNISEAMPTITADHPDDHGLDPEVARLVVGLRR